MDDSLGRLIIKKIEPSSKNKKPSRTSKDPNHFDYYELEDDVNGGPDISKDEEEDLAESQVGIPNAVLKLVNF